MWNDDGWDSQFKLGVVAPHADIGPEAEMQAMLRGVSATTHGARVYFSPMHPGGLMDDKIAHDPVLQFVSAQVLDPTVESLSSSPLDSIALAFTSSSFKIGAAAEEALLRRLRDVSHGVPLHTTGTAAVAALGASEAERIVIMAPSWFDEELCRAGEQYFRSQGFDVICAAPSGPVGGPLQITPQATRAAVLELVERHDASCVFIAGNGQRAVGAIEELERGSSLTVLTANQVLLWACLRQTGVQGEVVGYGRLFTLR